MQARRASRELALILFSQLEENLSKYTQTDFEDIILKSVRILSNNASEELKLTIGPLLDYKAKIEEYEAEHETNLARPIGASNKPVPMILTSELIEKIDAMVEVAEKAIVGLEMAEFATLESSNEVKDYVVDIAKSFQQNKKMIDELIQKYATGWDISRLVKIDKDILRIAITELLFTKGAPMKVIVDEALELAKKYSTEDSSAFVNGILAKIIVEKGIS
ncbi:transcription antitermination factor NusB [bacterium]|nr:transcription antitermination factor NusB [bacterium]